MENEEKKEVTPSEDEERTREKALSAAEEVMEETEEPAEKPHIDVEYDLTADEVRSGLYAFQRRVLYKRNIIYTILFAVVFVFYGIDVVFKNNHSVIAYLGIILCAVVVAFIWINPKRHREQLAKAMSEVNDKFTMQIYEEYIYIQQETGGFRILFSDPKVFVIEDSEKFVIGIGREQIFLLPKRCIEAGKLEKINGIFSGLGERLHKQ